MSLAVMLKEIRQKALMSQMSFSKALNVSVATINRWENGRATPNITAMSKIKEFCLETEIPFADLEKEWTQSNRRNSNGTNL
jgi:putative transcriptional regulator